MSVAKNTFYLTSALVGQKILSFVYFTLLARFLGPVAIGQYSFALAFTTIFSTLTDLGLTTALIREVAREKEKANEHLRTILGLKIILLIFAYGIVIATAFFLHYPTLILQLIFLSGIIMMLDALHLVLYGVLRGLRQLKFESIGMICGQAIILILGVIFLFLHYPLPFFLIALLISSLFNVIFVSAILRRQGFKILPHFHLDYIKFIIKKAWPFALAGIFVKVYSYLDTVLLKNMRGDLETGFYSVPYKITYAFQILPLALSAALFPALSHAWTQEKEHTREIYEKSLTYCALLVLPIVFGIAALAPEIILKIYGAHFAASIAPLRISIFGLLFIFLYYPVGALLNATNHQNINTFFMGLTMVFNIILNIILIPRFGAQGASVAAVLTNLFLFTACFIWANRLVKPSKKFYLTASKAFLATILMFIAVLKLKIAIFWLISVPMAAIIYFGLLWLFKAVSRDDWQKALEIVRPIKQ